MKKPARAKSEGIADIRPEYDFSSGVRGKYAEGVRSGTNVVVLDPDIAEAFPDSRAINGALRELVAIAKRAKPQRRSGKST